MAYLTAAQILAVQDLITEDVDVPEWGGSVRMRGLTAAERDALGQSMTDEKGNLTKTNNARARMVALSIVDDAGNRLFSNEQVKDLGRKSSSVLERLFEVVRRLSGLTPAEVQELEGNSDGDPSADLSSD